LGREKIIGLSTHTSEQLEAALREDIDYAAIGPIFATATKSDHEPVIGLEMLQRAAKTAGNVPLVAIGGISEENLPSVIDAGASSAAMIGAIVRNAGLIEEKYRRLADRVSQR